MKANLFLCLLALLLTGCASQAMPDGSTAAYPPFSTPTQFPYPAFSTPTQVPYPVGPSPEPISTTQMCAYQWANQSLPQLSAEVQAAVDAAGLTGVTVLADAFGENCLRGDGQPPEFLAMQTDFRVTVEVADLADIPAHGDTIAAVLEVLSPYTPQATPGPQPGEVWFRFMEGQEEMNLSVSWELGQELLARGLTGQALMDEISARTLP